MAKTKKEELNIEDVSTQETNQKMSDVSDTPEKEEDIAMFQYNELFNQLAQFLAPLGKVAWVENEDNENENDKSINIVRQLTEDGKPSGKQLFKIRITEPEELVFKK